MEDRERVVAPSHRVSLIARHITPKLGALRLRAIVAGLLASLVLHTSLADQGREHLGRPADELGTMARLTDLVFKKTVSSSGITKALVFRDNGYSFNTFEEINEYNIHSAHVIQGTARNLDLEDAPLESPYWWAVQSPMGATAFLKELATVLSSEPANADRSRMPVTRNVLQKALAQRDLFQIYSLVLFAGDHESDKETKALAVRLEGLIAAMFRSVLLSEHEYDDLVSSLPRKIPEGFTSSPSYSLSESYLPDRVVTADSSWTEVPSGGTPFRHFRDYGGRSFIKVYVRAPRLNNDQIFTLWKRLFAVYGEQLHATAVNESTPPGLETILIRSFGVFLSDGGYRDSFWPEEVIIRIFKYSRPEIDVSTSDFWGTLFFQYKMSRAALLREPKSLGLRRIMDDDEQFFGFFGDVPDMRNSYSDTMTTMRSNCISCHSELFYGLNTIFSFERDPARVSAASSAENSMLRVTSQGEYELRTREYASLKKWLDAM